ncbi:ion transporter [Alloalcanivorax gelatiniphagus]|uniref:Ion transporter n=1 Tax=Alloalcanivorax gelatiniphagus TaxID=1194167 RepID=A0ABY2XLE6_9GAMM|nr:ion transporter [Alloalcanivorax gelatiniphagus]TMW12119.1 ion transporter [Alloalcanivorax gelatiniphagus]
MQERGNAVYQAFMLALSIYVLAALILEAFLVKDDAIADVLRYMDLVVCLFFLLDFFFNLITAPSKRAYLKWGWIDFVSSIPALDTLRWGRLSRVIRIVRFFRSLRSLRQIYTAFREDRIQSLTLIVVLLTFLSYSICASLILYFERGLNPELDTAGDALWWALLNVMNAKITIASVVTREGQVMTMVLNKIGLLLFAYFNALIVAWLVNKRREGAGRSSA